MLGNRNSQHIQAIMPDVRMARSQFDRSHTKKMTFDFDFLVPVLCQEILPGDTMNLSLNTFARLATQKVPIMDRMMVDYFFFFCPNRLIWDKWERFMGERVNPDSSIDFICPQMTFPAGGPEVGTIFDCLGLPTDIALGYTIKNCLPLRAYNLIWNEWFRDENLQSTVDVEIGDGPDSPSDYTLLKRGKRHDYFTSGLPWPQKGDAVDLPLGLSAPVISNELNPRFSTLLGTQNLGLNADGTAQNQLYLAGTAFGSGQAVKFGTETGLVADLSSATSATINQLRQAFSIQSILELDARGGTRYVEILLSHFNVVSPDFRLQRPEYLGGGQSILNSHPVAQTAPTSGTDPQAQLAAFATTSNQGGIGFTKSFVEHGYVIGLACARADITYQQGVERFWDRSTRYDFFWPKLQELGEQAVLTKEIYVQGDEYDDVVFCYQERFAEYRYQPSMITGEFRSTYAQSLDYWHMAQEFDSPPGLDSNFITQNTPIERAIAITTAPHLLWDGWFNLKHARPMMTYSVPSTLGKF
jgi:hypothetical protein